MKHRIDWPSFVASIVIIFGVSIPLALFPETGGKFLIELYGLVSSHFGFLYLMAGLAVVILLLYLALGPYGKVRLASGN